MSRNFFNKPSFEGKKVTQSGSNTATRYQFDLPIMVYDNLVYYVDYYCFTYYILPSKTRHCFVVPVKEKFFFSYQS